MVTVKTFRGDGIKSIREAAEGRRRSDAALRPCFSLKGSVPSTISGSIQSRDTERERAAYQQMTATHASHNQSHSFPAAVLEMTSMPADLIGRLDAVGSNDASAKLWVTNLFPG